MNRRDLITGAAGLAGTRVLGSSAPLSIAQAAALASPARPTRTAPEHPLTVQAGELSITFDPQQGLPYAYSYKGKPLRGELTGGTAQAIVCRLEPRAYQAVFPTAGTPRQSAGRVIFPLAGQIDGRAAVSYELHYHLHDEAPAAGFTVTLESVHESPGFELIEVALPQMVTVREEDGPAWFAEGRHGGSFVRLEEAKAFRFADSEFFGRISTELPIGMVGQGGIACVMEVTAYHDATETEIIGAPGARRALLGLVQVHRVHGGRCYAMNDGGRPVCGGPHTPNLLVEQTPSARFEFFVCADGDAPWLRGAQIVRSRIPGPPTTFFADRFLYIVAGKNKTASAPRTTFAQTREMVHQVGRLTDSAPQTVFISGWVYDGQDTGYPSEDKVNSSLGTYEQLRELIESGKLVNANVTVNVNYDDAYKSSPLFDEAFIARRPDGEIWKSMAWDGEDSYIVGMAKFMEGGWGSRRISYTLDRYKISSAILIDALSWYAIRNDWDPQRPASGYKNLIDGKYKVLEQFRGRGIAVTSEQMRYPFVGRLAVSMDGPGISSAPFGGEAIPLVATVYRGKTIWGSGGTRMNEPGLQLFWNTRSSLWFDNSTDKAKMAEFYYLVVLPYRELHRLSVTGYERAGTVRRIMLEDDSSITRDMQTESYHAVVHGVEIARDGASFCPIDEHRIAFYARTARELSYPLPEGWNAHLLTARSLSTTGRAEHPVRCMDGKILVAVSAGQPVVVYSSEGAIPGS